MLGDMAATERDVPDRSAEVAPRRLDGAIADLAARQHGVVARRQLRALGLADSSISHRLTQGRLHPVHRGVFAVGHPLLSREGRWMAAVLACGPRAVLSHASAAALWEMRFNGSRWIDVTIPRTGRALRDDIRLHRPQELPSGEMTVHDRIPVTTAARTILDMAAILKQAHLERLLDQAEIRELTDYPALAALARGHTGHRGAPRLLSTLETHLAGEQRTRSDVEAQFRQLCYDHRLPQPRVNQRVLGMEVDFLFPAQRLIVETDSWRYHKTRRAFEDDRARDVLTTRAGYRTLRFTDRQLTRQPEQVAHAIAAVLADRRAA
jgi:very-short-patch-repair endonuclease